MKIFELKILAEKSIGLYGQQVKVTGVPGVFFNKRAELTMVNLKITMELFLSSGSDTLELLKERENVFMRVRAL